MKKLLIVLSLWTACPGLCAEFADLTEDIQLQTDVRNRIRAAGFDCAQPLVYREAGSDYRGKLYRVDCAGSESGRGQSFRIVERPGQPPRVERW